MDNCITISGPDYVSRS